MIMIYTGALLAKGHSPDINNDPGMTRIVPTFLSLAFIQIELE